MDKEKITQAVARGWCSAENEGKVVDATLAAAITEEVWAALLAGPNMFKGEYKSQLEKLYDKALAADSIEGVSMALHILELRYQEPAAITGTGPHGNPSEFRGSSGCAGDDLMRGHAIG